MLRLRQAMQRRIMLPCSRWPAWSAPLRVNARSAVNWASIRFIPEESASV